jgi:ADP-heptose:LPS heptosyltransferase
MQKLILSNFQSPGDCVMLTAAVRDLHRTYPDRFVTDVRTSCPELWAGNPFIVDIDEGDPDALEISCEYPLIHRSNAAPYHFIHGFVQDLNQKLRLQIELTAFHGDIHLMPEDEAWPACLANVLPDGDSFWLIVSGGKRDYTTKWWDPRRLQQVVDSLHGRIQFVQVGAASDHHPRLDHVIDVRGRTSLRELIQLVHHAQGVLTPVSLLMHLAAAVPQRRGHGPRRPCVVVAGGREPPHWEAYPHHQFIHTSGALTCCAEGGCWKARAFPLNDGDEKDAPHRLCVNLVGALPRCMDMITADEVVRRIGVYFDGGVADYRRAPRRSTTTEQRQRPEGRVPLTIESAVGQADRYLASLSDAPPTFQGRGIVMCGGGRRYFPCAWVAINRLRDLGCRLPIELWFLGPLELDEPMRDLARPLDVACIDGRRHRRAASANALPWTRLGGFELKPYAIAHSRFREVLFLDADNVPVRNPESLFDTVEYHAHGALFWPDYGRLARSRPIWDVCGVPYRDEPEFESGQIVIDKTRCWKALQLTLWYNAHSEFFYQFIHGDKDTFHMAFRRTDTPYAMPSAPIHPLDYTMCQHGFDGERMFQHRNQAKWLLGQPNLRIHGFWDEEICLHHLRTLEHKWDGRIENEQEASVYADGRLAVVAMKLVDRPFRYCRMGHDSRLLSFLRNGTIGQGAATNESYWDLLLRDDEPLLEIAAVDRTTCLLQHDGTGVWRGRWLVHEGMPIELVPA